MECVAFVKGVEVVLDYMLKVKDVKSAKSLLNHMIEAKEFERPAEPEQWIPAVEDGVSTDRTYRLL
jgi:hypothetical protein